jgi:hypothetical protein
MTQKWKIMYRSRYKIIWINYRNNETKICYLTYTDEKTPLPKGWERWFSTTYQLFYYRYIDNNGHKQIQWKSPKKLNQYNYSPTLETELDKDIINLDLKHGNKILEIEDKDKYVTLIYKGYNIPCTINKKSDRETEIKIEGREDDCLEFSIYIDDDNKKTRTAYIGLISITDNECPLPEKIDKKGTYLLSMVDEICRQLKINTLKLTDGSYITCKKNGETVSLAFLSLMKYGSSWYERNGFSYGDETKDIMDKFREIRNIPISEIKYFFNRLVEDLDEDIDQVKLKAKCKMKDLENWYKRYPNFRDQEYVDSLENVRERSLKNLRTRFNNVKNIKYDFQGLQDKIERMLSIISEYDENLKLYQFLTYLWNKDCSEYVHVMSVLYPKVGTRNYIDESILPNFPIYPNMTKKISI